MVLIERSALVSHSATSMYALVENVEAYPQFLPWCRAGEVSLREANRTVATLHIDYRGMKQHLTTDNRIVPGESIDMEFVSGPFRKLRGAWRFHALAEDAAKVEFRLEYEISNPLLARLIGPVFNHIANTMMDAFIRRADALGEGK